MNSISRLNRLVKARIDFVRSMPDPEGAFFLRPSSANISLTRRCNSLCPHCAPASTPDAPEHLSIGQVERFIDGLDRLAIGILHVEGGEPFLEEDLLYATLAKAVTKRYFNQLVLETNLSWATSPITAQEKIRRLASLGLASPDRTFVLASSLDSFHARAIPLEQLLFGMAAFYEYFPDGSFVLSHCYNPGDQTRTDFARLLDEKDYLVGVKKFTLPDGEEEIESYEVMVEGQTRTIRIDNKFPTLVGRGAGLRSTPYLAWRNQHYPFPFSLHETQSKLHRTRREEEIITLGWDGLLYHDVLFMHTQTYPLGEIEATTPWEALWSANKDPLLRLLYSNGVGALFSLAVKLFPDLNNKLKEGLVIEELAMDILADPEMALALVKAAADGSHLPKTTGQPFPTLMAQDWTGHELDFLVAVAEQMQDMSNEIIIKKLEENDFHHEEGAILYCLLYNRHDQQEKEDLFRGAFVSPVLREKIFTGTQYKAFNPEQIEIERRLTQALIDKDSDQLAVLLSVEIQGNRKRSQALAEFLLNMINLGLDNLAFRLLAHLPTANLGQLLACLSPFDEPLQKVAGLFVSQPGHLFQAVSTISDREISGRLMEQLFTPLT